MNLLFAHSIKRRLHYSLYSQNDVKHCVHLYGSSMSYFSSKDTDLLTLGDARRRFFRG